ncbi:hypothetical protein RDI58_027331 [Solanum bulbocastanum]|uniref:Uncharacterized protein n=1 Tax=Solanum bulbocastanum TaxID=147425 RepID=A0AAN8SVB0_SOLBU
MSLGLPVAATVNCADNTSELLVAATITLSFLRHFSTISTTLQALASSLDSESESEYPFYGLINKSNFLKLQGFSLVETEKRVQHVMCGLDAHNRFRACCRYILLTCPC